MVVIRIGLALLWSPRIGVILSQVHGHLAGMQSPTSVQWPSASPSLWLFSRVASVQPGSCS